MAQSIVEFYHDNGRFEEAIKWIGIAVKCAIADFDTALEVLAGQVYFEAGDHPNTNAHFANAFGNGRRRAFAQRDPKYLDYFLSNRQ